MTSLKLSTRACLVGFALLPASLFAQSLTLTLDSVVPMTTYAGHSGDLDFGSDIAGLENFTLTNQTGVSYPTSLSLFCIELQQSIVIGSAGNVFDVVSADQGSKGVNSGFSANIPLTGIGAARAHNLEVLYAHVFGISYNPSALSDPDRSAFQIAVWELSHDDDFNLTNIAASPHFWLTSSDSAVAQAQSWVSYVAAHPADPTMSLSALHSDTIQDFLIPNETAFSPIPEPSTTATILGLLVFLGVSALRRRIPKTGVPPAQL